MGKDLFDQEAVSKAVFEEADKTLGFDLSSMIFEGDAEELTLTYNAQPALLTTSIAILKRFEESGIKADYAAGHSLGEYTALVAAGALSFQDAVYAVRKRGELMNEAVPAGEGGAPEDSRKIHSALERQAWRLAPFAFALNSEA